MTRKPTHDVRVGFELGKRRIALDDIEPLRPMTEAIKKTTKFARIAASIKEVGIIEPPVVARGKGGTGKYLLLDGSLRIEVLKDLGVKDVECLLARDDEAFTYNKRVNRLAILQEHKMILKAIASGVSEQRLARALNIDIGTLQHKKHILDGICDEAAEILKDKHVSSGALWVLRSMAPMRQIEVAELMVAMNRYTISYARSLLEATPQSQLVSRRKRPMKGLSAEQASMMERESMSLEREFKIAEQGYGADHLDLVLAKGYLAKLLGNARVTRYLGQNNPDILSEFQKIATLETSSA